MSTNGAAPDEPTADLSGAGDGSAGEFPRHARVGERPGDQIGVYRLLSQVGEGGFGTVWIAERREPFVQRVAIKIIKPGMDSKSVIARFEQERQALAVMDHPNVAKVLDGGMTPGGRPYFVMELVKGEPITAFADRNRLTVRERLRLFVPVCEAVQHAHMKGIIHRDIKPSNILVTPGGEGHEHVVKVIDFGVAKAISHTLTDKTIFTEQGQLIGTPEYMSPEQAEMGATDIDTRTDVYSLGIVLYELLSGTLPFDPKTLRSAGYAEIQRIIREVDAPRPSTRLSTADERTGEDIARARQADRQRITGELRRELEWIPLKALRKDRARRYASAESLAADVQRYLDGKPLEAAPESRAYLLRKFVRRNRVQVAAGSAVAVALMAGVVATGLALNRALTAEQGLRTQLVATESAKQAEKERADQLKSVSEFQSRMLSQIDTTKAGNDLMHDLRERFAAALEKAGAPESERTQRAVALQQELVRVNATDAAAAMIDRTILKPAIAAVDEQFKNDPKTDASLRQALATLYDSIGLYDAALPLQESALATRRRVLGEEHADTIVSLSNTGSLLRDQGKLAEAEPVLREALEKSRRVLGEENAGTLVSMRNMAFLLKDQGRPSEAEPYLRQALEKSRSVLGDEHRDTLALINGLGTLLHDQGKLSEAEPYYREAMERSRRALGEEHRETVVVINNLGRLLQSQGRLAEAEPYLREALEKFRRVMGEEHQYTLTSMNNMGLLLHAQGRLPEVEPLWLEVVEKSRRTLGEEHPDTLTALNNLGNLLITEGRLAEAEALLREALEKSRRVLGPEHPNTLIAINGMGFLLQTQGKSSEAEPYWRETLEMRRRTLGEEHPATLVSISNFGRLLQVQGKLDEAEPYLRDALEKARRTVGEGHPNTIAFTQNLGSLLHARGQIQEAESCFREALEKSRSARGDEGLDTLISASLLVQLYVNQGQLQQALDFGEPFEAAAHRVFARGQARRLADFIAALGRARIGVGHEAARFTAAESNLVEAHQLFVEAKDCGPTHKDTLACLQSLVDLHTAWNAAEPNKGHDAKAAEWQAKLDAATPK